jgi:tetratricopeptide (TPR) repeat protein
MATLSDAQFETALKAIEIEDATDEEKAEMLMEMAMGIQQKPKNAKQIEDAIELYRRALEICPESAVLLNARIKARQATAYQSLPTGTHQDLFKAQDNFSEALKTFKQFDLKEECAETELNLGLVTQSLANNGMAKLTDAIQHYHNALRVFTKEDFPQDFAILHNNLAICYLSTPMSDERGKMREALAVQSFEEVLKVINIIDHPSEYAMINNNLGNALQYASSSHALANNIRALEAYNEALKVRNPRDTPMEYANTIANKANVLRNLPDDVEDLSKGNRENLKQAMSLYEEARNIFKHFGQKEGVSQITETLKEISQELAIANPASNGLSN